MQRYLIGAIAVVVALVFVVRWNSPPVPASSAPDAITVADLGPAKLRLVSGTTLEGGKAEPRQRVQFRLPFVNVGDQPIDLSRFRQCAVCCQGGKLVATAGIVPPQEKGELLFDVEASERPGRNVAQAAIEYVPVEPFPDSETLPNIRLQLGYELISYGFCEWELRDLDIGEIAVTGTWKHQFVLTEQLHEKGDPTLDLSCDSDAVELQVVAQTPAHGVYDIPAMNFSVECRVNPEKLGLGRQTAIVVAKTPLGDRLLRLRWHALPEYRFLPSPCVVFRPEMGQQIYRLNLRHLLDEPFVIERVTTELTGIEIKHPHESASQQAIAIQLSLDTATGRGHLKVEIRTSSGQLREESVPCVVEQLATIAEPTPAE